MDELNNGNQRGDSYAGTETRAPAALRTILIAMLLGALAGAGVAYIAINTRIAPIARSGVVTVQVAAPLNIAEPNAAQSPTIQYVAEIAGPSVLEVTTDIMITHPFWGSYITGGAGSAVVLSEDGYLITNNHVISDASAIKVRTIYGDSYEAVLIGADAASDVAVLRVDAAGLRPVTFADSDAAKVGELAIAIGNPLGTLGGTVTEGIISAKDRAITVDGDAMVLLQTSAAINPGNSGGGLFNGAGNLVGLVSMKSSGDDIEGLGFAIPSNIVRRIATELIEHGYVTGRPALGVSVQSITRWNDLMRFQLDEPGIYVMNVLRDSPIDLWDQIVAINGMEIQSETDVKAAISACASGDTAEVIVRRQSRTYTLQITLSEKTPEMTDADMY
ncbi:MAG: trypsin-like peptidase domain-containing protein [Oscillospiraceae bacterium]|jgi:serine protease Do|nr:trypsin-like peptidase domain-containing protein [Oscillospiraceae bacterium]